MIFFGNSEHKNEGNEYIAKNPSFSPLKPKIFILIFVIVYDIRVP